MRAELTAILRFLGVRSLLDVGCGDFAWMQHVDLDGIAYTGVDIVGSVIRANRDRYANAERTFETLDVVAEDLPKADALLCREVLFHLSFADGRRALENMKRSGAEHLIITSDTGTAFNSDIRTGDFRNINLQKRPYRFPPPRHWLPDAEISRTRGLGIWRVEGL